MKYDELDPGDGAVTETPASETETVIDFCVGVFVEKVKRKGR
jgi:hypothetical protein